MQVTTTDEPIITKDQFRAYYRAMYVFRKNEDVELFKKQKKAYNAKSYAKRTAEQKQLAYAKQKLARQSLKDETPTI